ncbi:MAG: shikimate kinase [Akkermansiaceae bacterium]|nr:shikimate kinase [Akkermansiaceae bacterium]NNM30468.1 shikimate kinase [Akkermansiaceae bacterium]
MLKNIILIGFMGSGKSSIGRELSKMLGYPLVDTDALIVERAGKPIRAIFEEEGEEAFRDLEAGVLAEIDADNLHRRIIATGGGIVIRPENRRRLRNLGYVVWLVVSPTEILKRTSRNKERPLLNNDDPEGTVAALLAERERLYRETANLTVETDALTMPEITTGIVESARYFFGST